MNAVAILTVFYVSFNWKASDEFLLKKKEASSLSSGLRYIIDSMEIRDKALKITEPRFEEM